MGIMTPEEQAHVTAYDELTKKQEAEQKEYAERPFHTRNILEEMKSWDEQEMMDTIKFLAKDIGVMRTLIEAYPGDSEVSQYAKHIILTEQENMMTLTENM